MSDSIATLLTTLRDRLDESASGFWTDPQLRRWLYQGATDIARRTQSLQDRADIVVVAGTQEYTAPTNMVKVSRVEIRETGNGQVFNLEYRDFNNMDGVWFTGQATTSSRPAYYTMWGAPPSAKIIVYPTPAIGGSLKVFYYRTPTPIDTTGGNDTAILEVPEGWSDLCVDYAEYHALRKDADPRWQEAKSMYDEKLEAMYENTLRWTDDAGMIVSDSGMANIPAWLYSDGWE